MKSNGFLPTGSLVILLLFYCPLVAAAQSGERAIVPGIEELYRLDRLAEFRKSLKVASVSSYDTTGGNNDGFGGLYSFVRREKDGLVLADLKGPGVIYRIWTPTPTDDVMEFYFDGNKEPGIEVEFRNLFMGRHPSFERPLVGYGAGGFYSYVPIPFEKSCRIFIRADTVQFYQINYAIYPDTLGLKSLPVQPDAKRRQHIEKVKKLFASAGRDISSYVAPGGNEIESAASVVNLNGGKRAVIFDRKQPGRIVAIRIGPAEALAGKKRDIVIRAYWDGDELPAINCPAGDFFGYAWGEPAMKSLLAGTSGGVSYCYFPMPFDKSARIELYAEPGLDRAVSLETEVLYSARGRGENEGEFYALWRRENPTIKGEPYTFIETKGRGHLVGMVQQSQGFTTGRTPFFEGDDQTIIDGELVIHGTGSEDFFNGGWYDVPGRWETRRSFVLSGCLGYEKHLGRTGGYRILLGDAYAYRSGILQTIEHAPTNNDLLNDYCSVTYLYSKERPTCAFELPGLEERRVIDPERIVFAAHWNVPVYSFSLKNATLTKTLKMAKGADRPVRCLSMRAKGGTYFGPHSICFTCELPAAGRYRITLDVVKGPESAVVQLFRDEAPAGPELDLYSGDAVVSEGEQIGTMDLEEGPNNLMFKLVGSNPGSEGVGFDLTNIIFERVN